MPSRSNFKLRHHRIPAYSALVCATCQDGVMRKRSDGAIRQSSLTICVRASSTVRRSQPTHSPRTYGAIRRAVDSQVDYAQLFKVFASELNTGHGRYSPPDMVRSENEVLIGNPDPEHVSTSFVERQNLTVRMENRRFTRLTNAFSKKLANLKASVGLHYAHYNFVACIGHCAVRPRWPLARRIGCGLSNS
jgi:hypothetical protein